MRTAKMEKKNKTKPKISEHSVGALWDNFKHSNIRIMAVPQGPEGEQEIGNLFEKIMTENFPNLERESDPQVQEAWGVPNKLDPKRPPPTHIITKMQKVKVRES